MAIKVTTTVITSRACKMINKKEKKKKDKKIDVQHDGIKSTQYRDAFATDLNTLQPLVV